MSDHFFGIRRQLPICMKCGQSRGTMWKCNVRKTLTLEELRSLRPGQIQELGPFSIEEQTYMRPVPANFYEASMSPAEVMARTRTRPFPKSKASPSSQRFGETRTFSGPTPWLQNLPRLSPAQELHGRAIISREFPISDMEGTQFVCADRDHVCGDVKAHWCKVCPKHLHTVRYTK